MSSSVPVFLLAGKIIISTRPANYLLDLKKVRAVALAMVLSACVLTGYRSMNGLLGSKFPLSAQDQSFMRPQDKATVGYLLSKMKPADSFYTLTSEGTWYYWLDRPSPTRHAIAWFAMPVFYQREIITDLENSKVRFILVKNDNWPAAIDGIPIADRLPIVMEYIKAHYLPDRSIGDNLLWERR